MPVARSCAPHRAVVWTSIAEAGDFLRVHFEDRGFTVDLVSASRHEAVAVESADVLVADVELWRDAEPTGESFTGALVLLSQSPSLEQAVAATAAGATAYLSVPFDDTRRLVRVLDAIAARVCARGTSIVAAEPEREPAHAG